MATDTDYAWAAGFIEADGCIHLQRYGNTKAMVVVVQKDRRPLDRLQRIFDDHSTIGVVARRGSTATYYRLSFSGQRAETLLLAILPYLEHKLEIAFLAIRLCGRIRSWGGPHGHGARLPEDELRKRLDLVDSARLLSVDAERLSEAAPMEHVIG